MDDKITAVHRFAPTIIFQQVCTGKFKPAYIDQPGQRFARIFLLNFSTDCGADAVTELQ